MRVVALWLGLVLCGMLACAGGASAATCAYTGGAATVDLPGHPFGAEASADGCWLFASLGGVQPGDATGVAVLRNRGGRFELVRTVPLASQLGGLSLSKDGALLAVAASDTVAVYDVARLESGQGEPLLARLPEGKDAQVFYVTITPDSRLLFASEEGQGQLTVWDLVRARSEGWNAAAPVGRIPVGFAPVGLAVSPDGKRLYSTSQVAKPGMGLANTCGTGAPGDMRKFPQGLLAVIDVDKAGKDPAQALRGAVAAGCTPVRVKLDTVHGRAWVTARGENALLVVDLAALEQAQTPIHRLAVGVAPVGLAVRPDGAQVWVSNSDRFAGGGGSLWGLSGATDTHQTIPSGQFPRDLSFLPDGTTLVAAVFGSCRLQFVATNAEPAALQPLPADRCPAGR